MYEKGTILIAFDVTTCPLFRARKSGALDQRIYQVQHQISNHQALTLPSTSLDTALDLPSGLLMSLDAPSPHAKQPAPILIDLF